MSNNFKRCQKFLEENGFKKVDNAEDKFVSYSNGFIDV